MEVLVAENCGFCPGVRNAIDLVEKTLVQKGAVYGLGQIIHNQDEVERLAKSGLRTVDSIEQIPGGTVIIRSHGAAPEQVRRLREKGLKIVDATCVLVKNVQHLARELEEDGYEVVVIGDRDHPEVRGVVGALKNAIVIAAREDLRKLQGKRKLGVVCQTTYSPENLRRIVRLIADRDFDELKVINTLCREAIKRQDSAVALCKKVDIMFVLGGLHSSNTRRLAELCKNYNKATFHLQNWEEFDKRMVFGRKSAGVTAGASTPEWIISDFVEHLKRLDDSRNEPV